MEVSRTTLMNGYTTILASKTVDVFQNCLTIAIFNYILLYYIYIIFLNLVNSAYNTWNKIDLSMFNQDGRGHKRESQDRMNKR